MNLKVRFKWLVAVGVSLLVAGACKNAAKWHGGDGGVARSSPASLTVALWPSGKMPGHGADGPECNMPSRGDGFTRITNISRPTLTMFPAPPAAGVPGPTGAPAVIICPGGGYTYVVWEKEGTEIAGWLNGGCVTAFVLKYRTPDNREGAFQDVQRAVRLVRARAGEWHIDPARIGVIGFSAGANLAGKASNRFDEDAYAPVDAMDRQSCRPDFAMLIYPVALDRNDQGVPYLHVTGAIPPTLLVQSKDDEHVTGSKRYQAALDEAHVPHRFLLYATGGHGYGLHCSKEARAWPQDAMAWLREMSIR